MNKKILLGSIFTISIIGMTHAETTDLNAIIGTAEVFDYTADVSTMTFSVDYYGDLGSITGHAQCSSQSGIGMWNGASTSDEITISASLPDSSGQYCYCTLDGYTPVGGDTQVLSAPWVFYDVRDDATRCANQCAIYCALHLFITDTKGLAFRSAVFNSVETPIIIVPSTISCELGYYLPAGATECALCPANSYCAGGEYEKSETADSGIALCQSGLVAPSGMWQAEQCGHALHIGDSVLYLRQTKQTEHALHIQHGNDIFYGNATTADVPMNINTNHRLKVQHNNVIYSIHDDTIQISD